MDDITYQPTVLVVGASRGIGAATARRFLAGGYRVAGTHRGSGVPEGVVPFEADVTDAASVQEAVRAASSELGRLDTLVVCAGITRDGLLMRMSVDDLRVVMETNAIGPMLACKAALRPMLKQRGGSIVLVSSMSVKYGVAGQTNYTASKGALEAFARSLAREHGAQGVRVNVVAPGATDTDMMSSVPERERTAMLASVPLGRLGTVDEVAEVIFRTSCATYMSGATVAVGGGL
jgi:3-oxoacyl-[acyl-carrier protein] reductase